MNNQQFVKVGTLVIIRKDGKVLFGLRKGSHGNNTWGAPGGHLELGESFEEGVVRETREEVGIEIENIKFLTVTNDIFGPDKHYVTIHIVCDYKAGEVTNIEPDKCLKWDWFEWNKLPSPLFLSEENLLKQNLNPFEV